MRSRITIELDFDNNNEPYIQIHQLGSEDMRDNVLKSFLEKLGGESQWLKIRCESQFPSSETASFGQKWKITPIKPSEISIEAGIMKMEQDSKAKGFNVSNVASSVVNGKENPYVDPMTIRCGPSEPGVDKAGSGSGW